MQKNFKTVKELEAFIKKDFHKILYESKITGINIKKNIYKLLENCETLTNSNETIKSIANKITTELLYNIKKSRDEDKERLKEAKEVFEEYMMDKEHNILNDSIKILEDEIKKI